MTLFLALQSRQGERAVEELFKIANEVIHKALVFIQSSATSKIPLDFSIPIHQAVQYALESSISSGARKGKNNGNGNGTGNFNGTWREFSESFLHAQALKQLVTQMPNAIEKYCQIQQEQKINGNEPLDKIVMTAKLKIVAEGLDYATRSMDNLYIAAVEEKDTVWALPLIHRTCALYTQLSTHAQTQQALQNSIDALRKFLQRMVVDRSPPPNKKLGCLTIINQMFKIIFRLNNLRLCNSLVKTVKESLPMLTDYPIAHVVVYNYYLGRLCVFEEKYSQATECLQYAFEHTHRSHIANKRRCLMFLIPVNLLSGKYPMPKLLAKYNLEQLNSLIQPLKKGYLKEYNQRLEEHREYFIKIGIFLLLEKLKILVYRNLFRRVYHLHAKGALPLLPNALRQVHTMSLQYLQAALTCQDDNMDIDELECILANLIFQGYVKGYIAHKRAIVLSKTNPFPLLTSVQS